MKRTTVFLTEQQLKRLAVIAKRKGFTVAQLIRFYVDSGLQHEK